MCGIGDAHDPGSADPLFIPLDVDAIRLSEECSELFGLIRDAQAEGADVASCNANFVRPEVSKAFEATSSSK